MVPIAKYSIIACRKPPPEQSIAQSSRVRVQKISEIMKRQRRGNGGPGERNDASFFTCCMRMDHNGNAGRASAREVDGGIAVPVRDMTRRKCIKKDFNSRRIHEDTKRNSKLRKQTKTARDEQAGQDQQRGPPHHPSPAPIPYTEKVALSTGCVAINVFLQSVDAVIAVATSICSCSAHLCVEACAQHS